MNIRPVSDSIHHLRPGYWLFLWAHSFTGYLLATESHGLENLNYLLQGLVAGGIWSVLLGAPAIGIATIFNAAPPPDDTPTNPSLGWISITLMLIGMILAPMVSWEFFDVYLIGMILAILHAVPPLRLGGITGAAVLCRAVGIGGLTLFSGYAAVGIGIDHASIALHSMGMFFFLAIAVSALLVPNKKLHVGLAGFVLSILFAITYAVITARTSGVHWYGALLGLPPLAAWVLLGWARFLGKDRPSTPPSLFICAAAWFLTDLCMVLMGMVR